MIGYIKWLLCKHRNTTWIRNIYGDEIIFGTPNFHRSIHECHDCNSYVWKPNLK